VDQEIESAELRACGHGRPESFERGDLVRVHRKRIKPPQTAQLPAYQAMRLGIAKVDDDESVSRKDDDD